MTKPRGRIRNREFALVERDFSGLRWEKITPTDIDGFVEFGNRLFVFIEGKHPGAQFSGGQKLALQRLTSICNFPPNRYAFAVVVDQVTYKEVDENGVEVAVVDYANSIVREFLWNDEWRRPRRDDVKCKEFCDWMVSRYRYAPLQVVKN